MMPGTIPSQLAPLPGAPAPQQGSGLDALAPPQQGPSPQQQADVQAQLQNVSSTMRQATLNLDSQLQQIQGIVSTFPLQDSALPGKMADAVSQLKQMWAELLMQVTTQAPQPQGAVSALPMQ